jgi:putative flippase GtrA
MFLLMVWLLPGVLSGFWVDLLPMVVARLVSCVINFYINQKLVFQSQRPMGIAFLRYMLQATPIAVLQLVLTFGIYALFSVTEEQVALRGVIYAGIMVALFLVSYLLQKLWVFKATEQAEKRI